MFMFLIQVFVYVFNISFPSQVILVFDSNHFLDQEMFYTNLISV